jgi:serine/threonine protein kinase
MIRELMLQLLEGLAAVHELNITHRDIKPQVGRCIFTLGVW